MDNAKRRRRRTVESSAVILSGALLAFSVYKLLTRFGY
jgi:hypothetical protein